MKSNPDNGYLCVDFDKTNQQVIFGREEDADYQRLEAILAPCNYIHDYVSDNGDKVAPECISDPVKQFEYLGTIQTSILHNNERLRTEIFDDSKIIRESMIRTQ